MKQLDNLGYTIAIFSNQHYKSRQKNFVIARLNSVLNAIKAVGVNPSIFGATKEDEYRKPNIGMWQLFIQYDNHIDKNQSFFIGDAAGRPQDFSDADKEFARNIGLPFITPGEVFPKQKFLSQIPKQCLSLYELLVLVKLLSITKN